MLYQRLRELYDQPFLDLVSQARQVHERHWPTDEIQLCTLLSIKTGACPEDCKYCSQSVHNETGIESTDLMDVEEVRRQARIAKDAGSGRFCMGAGWREPRDDAEFEQVLAMVREVRELGMEACVTLGMLNQDQAQRLKDAGLTSYNHNIDTSPEYYDSVITTRTFEDRIETLRNVSQADLKVCSGGILGLGESIDDRLRMLEVLSELDPQPESVPINRLVPIEGTPLEGNQPVDAFEMCRIIALARISIPGARVRLSAGREDLSEEAQTLCFFAGANSIFYGERLLTTGNVTEDRDLSLIEKLGLKAQTDAREAQRESDPEPVQ
ncbi:MAG: biotin synthase BioB [Planctomycetota bacterium]|nr:biotin synthase BioB [Planctomycetota bacterium]